MAKKKRKSAVAKKTVTANRELKTIIWFAVSLFLMALVFIKGENFWTVIRSVFFGMFGVMTYVMPFLLLTVALITAFDKMDNKTNVRMVETSVLILLVSACIDIFMTPEDSMKYLNYLGFAYERGTKISGGGFFGALIGNPVYRAFGKTAAAITVILLIFVLLMLITGATIRGLIKATAKPVKAISDEAQTVYGEVQARREAAKEQKAEGKKQLRVIRGFNVDIPIDEPEEEKPREPLSDKQKKVVSAYNDQPEAEESFAGMPEEISTDMGEALATAEGEQKPERITVDFQEETEKVTEEINSAESEKTYIKPPVNLLKETASGDSKARENELQVTSQTLVDTLKSFGVETRVVDISRGPTVTRYELQPRAGVKISKITSLADDIALNLASAGVRIEAPIPNKAAVGIEVPNKTSTTVGVREIIESSAFTSSRSKLTVAMGRDIAGNVVVTDIAKMPHGLIAGATGSGKSVCINSIIMSILYKADPDEVKLLMIDPKVVELGVYNGIPHLLVPVVTEPRKAAGALGWAVTEMESRYRKFADRGVRDIEGYNRFVDTLEDEPDIERMPHIVIIIDELADLMMTAPREVEDSINRIAAKARAAGMHLLIATQRPSVDVVTGVIKANIPTRIAFAVSSQIDSRTILDTAGAEKLLGRGDMLFHPVGASKPTRLQGCFVSDGEVERVVEFVKNSKKANYDELILEEIERNAVMEKQKKADVDTDEDDADLEIVEKAMEVVVDAGMASTSLLQTKLKLGYARARRIVDILETKGVVGPYEGSKPRKVLITRQQLDEMKAGGE